MKLRLKLYLISALLNFAKFLRSEKSYKINGKKVILPMEHLLPSYRKYFPRYDRFIEFLGRHLPDGSVVIDVGANIGDTLAALYDERKKFNFYCVEADERYFKYLNLNIEKSKFENVYVSNDYVGVSGTSASLVKHGSSMRSSSGDDKSSKTLSEIFPDVHQKICAQSLIKIDTDGSDYNVILGSGHILGCHPQLFFEMQVFDQKGYDGYNAALSLLEETGGYSFVVFDNYGEILLETDQIRILRNLLSYIFGMVEGATQRTIYYYDVYAYSKEISKSVTSILAGYRDTR